MTKQPFIQSFDREQSFEANKRFRYLGKDYVPGEPFDQTKASTRRLRQLYEVSMLRYAGTSPGARLPQEPPDKDQRSIVANSPPPRKKLKRLSRKDLSVKQKMKG